jgi:hypothetical protein
LVGFFSRVDEGDVGDVDRGFHRLDAARLGAALGLAHAGVLGDVVDALDDDAVLLDENVEDLALLAAVAALVLLLAGDDLTRSPFLIFAMRRSPPVRARRSS